MPFGVSRSAQFFDKEVLKYGVSLDGVAVKHVVLDATDVASWPIVGDTRNVVPAGTPLKLSSTNTNQAVKWTGSGAILGILARPVDLLAQTTAADEPAPAFFHNVVFATKAIVGFTQYASAFVSLMTTCKFE
jgi:hypothetical protein